MKTIITFMLLLFCMTSIAQDKIYVQTATVANTSGHITYIDHPDLNGNPDAPIVYVNNFNPNGGGGVFNNNVSGLWYNGSQWTIYNEDLSDMVVGASFNIYIASDPNDVFIHVATPANTSGHITNMDNALVNGLDPGPFLAFCHYYNPNAVYNTGNYGQYYFGDFRRLFDEGFTAVPDGAGFKVLVEGGTGSTQIEHISAASNIVSNWTIIDAPALNGNPDATFVMSHYWGVNGPSGEVYLNAVLGVWYNGSNWAIYTEDTSIAFPENVAFDIIVAEREILGVDENQANVSISMFPNPADEIVNFKASQSIENVTIYNMLGQEILRLDDNANNVQMDVSSLSSGTYLTKVKTDSGAQTLQLIKE